MRQPVEAPPSSTRRRCQSGGNCSVVSLRVRHCVLHLEDDPADVALVKPFDIGQVLDTIDTMLKENDESA